MSFLIDYLPAYLFPLGERTVDRWGVAGISLGGHSAWILLGGGEIVGSCQNQGIETLCFTDTRIQVGIPIIGCPDYVKLMQHRAETCGIIFDAPNIPTTFLKTMSKTNPASKDYATLERSNPFLGKKILVLSGAEDKLVPWVASQEFYDHLEVGAEGVKELLLQTGAGHECTGEMVDAAARFVERMMV